MTRRLFILNPFLPSKDFPNRPEISEEVKYSIVSPGIIFLNMLETLFATTTFAAVFALLNVLKCLLSPFDKKEARNKLLSSVVGIISLDALATSTFFINASMSDTF